MYPCFPKTYTAFTINNYDFYREYAPKGVVLLSNGGQTIYYIWEGYFRDIFESDTYTGTRGLTHDFNTSSGLFEETETYNFYRVPNLKSCLKDILQHRDKKFLHEKTPQVYRLLTEIVQDAIEHDTYVGMEYCPGGYTLFEPDETKDNYNYYKDFFGCGEVEIALSDGKFPNLHVWDAYFEAIFDYPPDEMEGRGFTRDYVEDKGAYALHGEFYVIPDPQEYLDDLLEYTEFKYEETAEVHAILVEMLRHAIANGAEISMMYF